MDLAGDWVDIPELFRGNCEEKFVTPKSFTSSMNIVLLSLFELSTPDRYLSLNRFWLWSEACLFNFYVLF